ncbi:hypothetical protein [Thalassospira sp.]|uniref:hypothetical protein n=1 Tax=Thalassospira sp. TaxID=1912094 RepID=UPI003AA7DC72
MVKKDSDWLNAIVISGVAIIAFLIGALYGKEFYDLQWETLLAGTFGLIGGWLAYRAATYQQRVIEKSNSLAFKSKHRDSIADIDDGLKRIVSSGEKRLPKSIGTFFSIEQKLTEILSQPHIVEPALTEILAACMREFANAKDISKQFVGLAMPDDDRNGFHYPISGTGIVYPSLISLSNEVDKLRDYCSGYSIFS